MLRRLLANALLDMSNERFVLLSESCIPLYNFTMTYNYIMRSKFSFMGAFDEPGPYGRGRYDENMLPEVNITKWRKGSQWFEINRKLALYVIEDTKFYPKFDEFCQPACYVDEHYFPTMLTIKAANLLANRSITWVDWSRGGAHPATFGGADITEEFMERVYGGHSCLYNDQPSSICYLFARKFSPSALEALFLLAPKFLGAMAVSQTRALVVAMAVVTIFALIGSSAAQEAPAPAPTSSAGVVSPLFPVGCAVAVVSFIFGSALRI
ncbi:UNVERIFIED_CONTAM: Glycosyltransferase BC10 [Sesamum calycinum]|uniref:Glycosyltransferase BC10 n=1 Tax=Sesamum calycinum TaxID=2727403 RepID=A0AAW2QW74_9LAMI